MAEAVDRVGENVGGGGWASGSLAVVIPVEVERPVSEGHRRPGVRVVDDVVMEVDPVWDLKSLRRATSTDPLVSPRETRVPIRDIRITQTQTPMHYQLHLGATAERERPTGPTTAHDPRSNSSGIAPPEVVDDLVPGNDTTDNPRRSGPKAATPPKVPVSATNPARAKWWTVKAVEVFAFDTPLDVFDTPVDLTTERTHHIDTPAERERKKAVGEEPGGHDRDRATEDLGAKDRFMAYVVVHVVLKPAALHAIRETVAYFSLPSSAPSQTQYWPVAQLRDLFSDLGLDGTVRWRRRPFVLTHLVPAGEVPAGGRLLRGALERGWTDEQIWAWRLANGPDFGYDNEPGWGTETPTRGGFWSGSTWCRIGRLGAASIGTRPLGELPTSSDVEGQVKRRATAADQSPQYVEHVRVEAFAHRNAVDLVILAMRQTRFLQKHATELRQALVVGRTGAPRKTGGVAAVGDADTDVPALMGAWQAAHNASVADLATALALERRLIEFRNELWLDHAPGEPDVSATIAGLHEALGSNRLLSEIDAEQQDMTRILRLARQEAAAGLDRVQHDSAVAQAAAAQATEETQRTLQKDARDRAADQKQRREFLDRMITFVAPLVAVPGVVVGFTQIYQGSSGGRPELWWSVLLTSVLCLAAWEVLTWVLLGKHLPALVKEFLRSVRRYSKRQTGAQSAPGSGKVRRDAGSRP